MADRHIIEIRAGERCRIIRRFSNSLSMTYSFRAESMKAGEPLSGKIEIAGSKWLFPKAPQTQALKRDNSVSKTVWDTFYSVYVTPDVDARIMLERSRILNLLPLLITAILITAVAAVIMMSMLR